MNIIYILYNIVLKSSKSMISCYEMEIYYVDNQLHESNHYVGTMCVDSNNEISVQSTHNGKIFDKLIYQLPYNKLVKYGIISGIYSSNNDYYDLNICEFLSYHADEITNPKPQKMFKSDVKLNHIECEDEELSMYFGKDENDNIIYLKLKAQSL
jgi:hypothetical protein